MVPTCLQVKAFVSLSNALAISFSLEVSISRKNLHKCNMSYLPTNPDTCWALASANNLTFTQFLSYNPSINTDCSNLLTSTNICLTLPGPTYNGTTIAGATATQTASYATTTAAIPSKAAPSSTRKCGKWYAIVTGDYCQIVALHNTIPLPLFTAINPSIDATCSYLVTDLSYCVWPTSDWNATSTNPIPPPAPTPPGTTNTCYTWYTVQSGDGCYSIEQEYEISLPQLQAWNPDLHADCGNLLLGDAYCVSGGNSTSATTTTTAT